MALRLAIALPGHAQTDHSEGAHKAARHLSVTAPARSLTLGLRESFTTGAQLGWRRVADHQIETERLLLRPWGADDAAMMQRELSRIEMARMLAIPHPYPERGAANWIATARSGREFAIVVRDTRGVVGGISLFEQEQHRRAELGYWCAIDSSGTGIRH